MAQSIGLIMYEFGYTFDEVFALTSLQFSFLLSWLKCYYEKVGEAAKPQ